MIFVMINVVQRLSAIQIAAFACTDIGILLTGLFKWWNNAIILVYIVLCIHASGVLDFLLDRVALWVGELRKVGINLQLRYIGLHRVTWLQ